MFHTAVLCEYGDTGFPNLKIEPHRHLTIQGKFQGGLLKRDYVDFLQAMAGRSS